MEMQIINIPVPEHYALYAWCVMITSPQNATNCIGCLKFEALLPLRTIPQMLYRVNSICCFTIILPSFYNSCPLAVNTFFALSLLRALMMGLIQVQTAAINTTGSFDNFSSVEVPLRFPHAAHLTLGLSSRSAKRSNTVEKYSSRIYRLLGARAGRVPPPQIDR